MFISITNSHVSSIGSYLAISLDTYPKHSRPYDISVNYTDKNIGKRLIDYLGPNIFNQMSF